MRKNLNVAESQFILGLKGEPLEEDIKRAFRARIRQCHPDRNGGSAESERETKRVLAAYKVLMEESVRPLHHAMAERFAATGQWASAAPPSPTSIIGYDAKQLADIRMWSVRGLALCIWACALAYGSRFLLKETRHVVLTSPGLTTISVSLCLLLGMALGSRRMPEARSWDAMGLALFTALTAESFGLEARAVDILRGCTISFIAGVLVMLRLRRGRSAGMPRHVV